MAFFGLKLGLDFEMRAAHPHQKFQGVAPRAFTVTVLTKLPSVQAGRKDFLHITVPQDLNSIFEWPVKDFRWSHDNYIHYYYQLSQTKYSEA